MPTCIGCGASYNDSEELCPYCGRHKPAAPKVELNVKVTENVGKTACPSCCRADKVQKVSAIIASQTYSSGGQTSLLAQRLSKLPAKPQQITGIGRWRAFGLFFLFIGILFLFSALFNTPGSELPGAIFTVLLCTGLPSVIGLAVANGRQARADELKKYEKRWRAAMRRYNELFYCAGCDSVYIPREGHMLLFMRWKNI